MSDQGQPSDPNEGTQRNARGDTPTQAAAEGAPDPNLQEERMGADVREIQRGDLPGDQPRLRETQAQEYTVYHPHGFAVPVRGKARRDELLSRGYTEHRQGDQRDQRLQQQGIAER